MARTGGRRLAANVGAERVLAALKEARPSGLAIKQSVAATGLTLYQVARDCSMSRRSPR